MSRLFHKEERLSVEEERREPPLLLQNQRGNCVSVVLI
jgi:hypothetical protein